MKSTKRITLAMIAEQAGLTTATVSLALRDSPRLAVETRQRVHQIAEQLGYRPDPRLSELMTHLRQVRAVPANQVLALVNPLGPAQWEEIKGCRQANGMRRRAAELGFRLEEFRLGKESASERDLTRILWNRGIEGLIIYPFSRDEPRARLALELGSRFAAVTTGYSLTSPDLHRVCSHHFHNIALALEELRRLGYRRIGLALEKGIDARVQHLCTAAYLSDERQAGVRKRIPCLVQPRPDKEGFWAWFQKYRPDALLTSGDPWLIILEWLQELGVKVPEEVGYANLHLRSRPPGVSGIDQSDEELGAAVVDLLVNVLHRNERGVPSSPQTVLLKGHWVGGKTTTKIR